MRRSISLRFGMRMIYVSCWMLLCPIWWMFLLLCELHHFASGITLAPVFWNSSNPIFKQSKNSHTIEVSLYDQIDFICPFYARRQNESSTSTSYEYYVVYQVTKEEYENCSLSSREAAFMIVNCSNPFHPKRFTILFEMFQAIPNVPEFIPGNTYYYISTSTGQSDGLYNNYLGACDQMNMRLVIFVCCDTSSDTLSSNEHGWHTVESSPDLNIPHQGSSFVTSPDISASHTGLANKSCSMNAVIFAHILCWMLSISLCTMR